MSRAEQHLRDHAATGVEAEPAERFFVMPMSGSKGPKMAPGAGDGKKGKEKEAEAKAAGPEGESDPENGSNTVFMSLFAGWLGLGHEAHLLVEGVKIAMEIAEDREQKINPDPKAAINPKFAFNFGKEAKPEPALYGSSSKKADEEMLGRLAKRRTSGSSMSGISMGRSPSSPGFR